MRDLVVFVPDCQSWGTHATYAAGLARLLHASLTGIHVSPVAVPIPDVASPALSAEIIEIHRAECERARRAETPFRQWAAAQGIRRNAWRLTDGPVSLALESAAKWYDALIVEHDRDTSREYAGDIGQMLVRTDLPCFVVPAGIETARLETIAIAWNGTSESVRALRAAMPLLRHATRIVLICGQRNEPFAEPRWSPPIDIVEYLAWQDLRAERVNIAADSEHAGATILAQAERVSADLLVLGAYGRTRFSEWFLGGVTRHVLQHARLPLLMRH